MLRMERERETERQRQRENVKNGNFLVLVTEKM